MRLFSRVEGRGQRVDANFDKAVGASDEKRANAEYEVRRSSHSGKIRSCQRPDRADQVAKKGETQHPFHPQRIDNK